MGIVIDMIDIRKQQETQLILNKRNDVVELLE